MPLQVLIANLCSLVFGIPWAYLYTRLSRRLSHRSIILCVIALTSTAIALFGLVFTSRFGGFGAAYAGCEAAGLDLSTSGSPQPSALALAPPRLTRWLTSRSPNPRASPIFLSCAVLAVVALCLAPALTWWFSIYWPAFMALVPEAQVNQYAGVFNTTRLFGLIWHSGPIYTALVQSMPSAADGHRLGLLSMRVCVSNAPTAARQYAGTCSCRALRSISP